MIRYAAAVFALAMLLTSILLVAPPPARADASQALQNVLAETRGLSDADFSTLVGWAKNGTPRPFMTTFQPQQTQADILALGVADQNATLQWLQGYGRGALYARGATDDQIGPRRPAADGPLSTPTPNPWRTLPLATATLDNTVSGGINVLGGFAAARRNGTAAIACVSFENQSAKTASRVVIDFPLLGGQGNVLGKLTLDRHGEFSPNVGIMSYATVSDWQQNVPPRSRKQNCAERVLGTAALPILEARLAGYRVVRVEYSDGSVWPLPH